MSGLLEALDIYKSGLAIDLILVVLVGALVWFQILEWLRDWRDKQSR